MRTLPNATLLIAVLLIVSPCVHAADMALVSFDTSKAQRLSISIGGEQVAVYYQEDTDTIRPFFAHLRAPGAPQVTRNHPPIEGRDLDDHGSFHPGLWMSFGDISGSDYWRLSAQTKHVKYLEMPQGERGRGSFAVHNHYLDQNDPSKIICEEDGYFSIHLRPNGFLLLWDCNFYSEREFYFGDQEEMGLGLRVTTPIRVDTKSLGNIPAGNGTILDSQGRKNGNKVWGNSADWCDYSGTLKGHRIGMTLFCHPNNFRPSWFHARDYGLLEANPFGREAFGKGEKSKIFIKPGEKLRLRYGVFVHASPEAEQVDLQAEYDNYLEAAGR